jgi:predicted unusual protein kinase regulating ubiquinone biosynthesis (AarF/ABC1/UbiB family)
VSEPPRNAMSRTFKLASLPLGLAGRATVGIGRRIGGASAEVVSAELSARSAEQLFRVLGELKGGAMKFGQALSVFEAALPDNVIGPYREQLTKLQEAAPPMSPEITRQCLVDQLGVDWRAKFVEFDEVPAAAASIGQVHRAVWSDGREVAVKLQYPWANDAIRADLRQVRRLGRAFGSIAPGMDVRPLLDELRDRLMEELDYAYEAQAQEGFAAAFADDPDIIIPGVVASGPQVLVSEWLEGTPLSKVIATGTQAERDHAGLLYSRFHFSAPARAHLLHADPHPGNYRIMPGGRLGVLDFGAVARLPDGLPHSVGPVLRAALENDRPKMLRLLRDEGFVKQSVDLDPDDLYEYLAPFVEPAAVESFHFSRAWMRAQFERVNNPRGDGATGFKINLPPSYLLIHRVWLGALAVLSQLEAQAPFRGELLAWVPGFADPDAEESAAEALGAQTNE